MSTETKTFKGLFDSVRNSLPYKVEGLIIGFTEQVSDRMKLLGLSRSEFAQRLQTSPACVTKFLSGGTNFTLESIAKAADALDVDVRIDLVPKTTVYDWAAVVKRMGAPQSAQDETLSFWSRSNKQANEPNRLIHCCSNPRWHTEQDWLEQKP